MNKSQFPQINYLDRDLSKLLFVFWSLFRVFWVMFCNTPQKCFLVNRQVFLLTYFLFLYKFFPTTEKHSWIIAFIAQWRGVKCYNFELNFTWERFVSHWRRLFWVIQASSMLLKWHISLFSSYSFSCLSYFPERVSVQQSKVHTHSWYTSTY